MAVAPPGPAVYTVSPAGETTAEDVAAVEIDDTPYVAKSTAAMPLPPHTKAEPPFVGTATPADRPVPMVTVRMVRLPTRSTRASTPRPRSVTYAVVPRIVIAVASAPWFAAPIRPEIVWVVALITVSVPSRLAR